MRNNQEIDYKIYGEELQFVELELDPQETVVGEPVGFMMMDDGIDMQTILGDSSQQQGSRLLGRLMNAFVHAGGFILERELKHVEILKIDAGCVVTYQPTIDFDIELVGGVQNWMFGGEGLFFALMRCPGKVWIQSLPISRLASRIIQYSPQFGNRREEGSVLGGLGGLFGGDR